ncbi:MAG: GDSL-type esterase/lipase family protein, partial [Angustibacter sp.]
MTQTPSGPRPDVRVSFVGDSYVLGYGDPRALGWVGRVAARTPADRVDLTVHNLGIRGDTTSGVLARWRAETARRCEPDADNRVVIAVGANDVGQGVS